MLPTGMPVRARIASYETSSTSSSSASCRCRCGSVPIAARSAAARSSSTIRSTASSASSGGGTAPAAAVPRTSSAGTSRALARATRHDSRRAVVVSQVVSASWSRMPPAFSSSVSHTRWVTSSASGAASPHENAIPCRRPA
jgi:hypothetical protein